MPARQGLAFPAATGAKTEESQTAWRVGWPAVAHGNPEEEVSLACTCGMRKLPSF